MSIVKNEDFIQNDFLKKPIEQLKAFQEVLKETADKLKEVGSEGKKSLEEIEITNITDVQKLNKILEEQVKVLKQVDDVEKLQIKTAKEKKKLTDEDLKLQAKQKKELAERKKLIQAELILQEKTNKSVESLTQRNKALTIQANSLNLETAEGVEQFKAINREILDNQQEVKKLKDEVKQAKISQEAYNKALKIENEVIQGNIKSRKELKDANKQLRIAVDNLDIDSQADEIERFNAVIDRNTALIEENSDEQIKAKINVGRYAESVQELLQNQGLLSKEIEIYNTVVKISNFLTRKNTKETEDNTEAKEDLEKATKEVEDANEDLNNSFKKSVIGVIISSLISLGSAWATTSEGADTFRLILANINSFIQITINRAGALANFLIKDLKSGFIEAKKDVNDLKISILSAFDSPILKKFGLTFKDINKDLEESKNLSKEYAKQISDLDSSGQEDLLRASTGFSEQLKNIIEENKILLQQEKEKLITGRTLQKQIATQTGLLLKLEQLRDNESVSLQERLELSEKVEETIIRLGNNQIKFAQNELNLTNDTIRRRLKEQNILQEFSDQEINRINENVKFRKFINAELLDQQTENLISLQEANNEFEQNQIDNLNERATLEFDLLEQRLDRSIQFNDVLLSLNEEIIASDTITLNSKLEAQKKINQINKESFDLQIKNLVETQKKVIETEIERLKIIGASNKEIQEKRNQLLIDESEIRRLLSIQSANQFVEELENLKQAERINTRTAELLTEQFNIKQKTLEIDKSINEEQINQELLTEEILIAEKEILKTKQLNSELEKILQEDITSFTEEELKKRNEKIKELEDQRTKIEEEADQERTKAKIDSLNKELQAVEKGSSRELEIKKELLSLEKELLNQKVDNNIEANNKVTDSVEDSSEDQSELAENLSSFLISIIQKTNQKRIDSIDQELSDVEKAQSRLQNLAENGNEEAVLSLEQTNKKQSELRLEKEKELQRQKKIEAGLSAFQLLSANASEDPNTALQKTFSQLLATQSFVDALPTFYSGTEHIGEAVGTAHFPTLKKDAYLGLVDGKKPIRIDGEERIIPGNINKMLINEGIKNKDLPEIISSYKRGISEFNQFEKNPVSSATLISTKTDNSRIESELKSINKNLKKKFSLESYYDNSRSTVVEIVNDGNRRIKRKSKIKHF